MTMRARKWIVGLDLRPLSQGAMRFAVWMAKRAAERGHGNDSLAGIHVIADDHMRAALRYHHYDEVMKAARDAVDAMVGKMGETDDFAELHVVQGISPEKTLDAARTYHHAAGIIIGRYAKAKSHSLRRLGRVARRVLRTLSSPVIVVPPDWSEPSGEPGPVVATCNLRGDSAHGVRFAAAMAERLGVGLTLVYVVPLPDDYGAHYLPEASLEKLREDHQQEGEQDVATFIAEQGLANCEPVVRQGGVVENLLAVAKEKNASLVVSGSRRLSAFERLLLTSIGSELAATSPAPVAVVPPVDADETPDYVLD